jgi:hypothetical protein
MRIVDVTLDHWRVPPHREIRDAVQQMEAVEVVVVAGPAPEVPGTGVVFDKVHALSAT